MNWKISFIRVLTNPQGIERWREGPQLAESITNWANRLQGDQWLTYSQVRIINAAAQFLGTGRRLQCHFTSPGQRVSRMHYSSAVIKEVLECPNT